MQQFSSRINIKKLTLIPLLLIAPIIGFLLFSLYVEYGNGSFLESFFSILPESLAKFIAYPISAFLICFVFLLCCVSSFFCGKVISEKNKYIYLIKCFMCIFWIIGMWFLFLITAEASLFLTEPITIAIILIITTFELLFKAVVDIIQFVYDMIKNKKHKTITS